MQNRQSMDHILLVVPRESTERLVEALYAHGTLHITDRSKWALAEERGHSLAARDEHSQTLARIRDYMAYLGVSRREGLPPPATLNLESVFRDIDTTRSAGSRLSAQQESKKITYGAKNVPAKGVAQLKALHSQTLQAAEELYMKKVEQEEIARKFTFTSTSTMVSGWVPKENRGSLEAALRKQLGSKIHISEDPTSEEAPIQLRNSDFISSHELLLRMYSMPSPKEIDPTLLVFLSFPIFFGFILGDAGYGLLILLAAIIGLYTTRKPIIRSISRIMLISAISTTIFGLLYGEFFGHLHMFGIELPHLIHRQHDMQALLFIAIGIGVLHISLALIIGFFNELRAKGGWHAVCTKLSWLGILLGTGLVLAHFIAKLGTLYAGCAVLVISLILLWLGEGIKGFIEIPAIFSNISSYARLMAIGVASAALAIVINEIAHGMFLQDTVLGFIVGVLILLVGHAINLALGIFGGFMHSLRLHYVEFFGRFYEGGGKPYLPFGRHHE